MERTLAATGKEHWNGMYTSCYRQGTMEWNVHCLLQARKIGMERILAATGKGQWNGTYTRCYSGTLEWNVH